MYLKLVPWNSDDREYRVTRIKEVPDKEVDYVVRHPLDRDTGLKLLEEHGGEDWSAVWSMPLHDPQSNGGDIQGLPDWPGNGMSLIFFSISDNHEYQTYVAFDCDIYVMSDQGHTIDRIR